MSIRIAPSILAANFGRLADEVQAVAAAGADLIHFDVMDGRFVPQITLGPLAVAALKQVTTLPLDVHLMIEEPEHQIENFARAGASIISVHAEACPHLQRVLAYIRSLGVRPAVALNPATPLESIEWVLGDVDMVLLMTVNPGFGGQAFLPSMLAKISDLKRLIAQRKLSVDIEVDGGIKTENIAAVAEAGARIFVSGSAIFSTADYAQTISAMRRQAIDSAGN